MPQAEQESLESFRQRARAFLDEYLKPADDTDEATWGTGSDRVGLLSESGIDEQAAEVEEATTWRRAQYEAGFGWITGPVEYGGAGLSDEYEAVWYELLREYDVPSQGPFFGLGMIAPTIHEFGSTAMCEQLLPAMYRGDAIACQLFSEPGAGSDLASLSTFAAPQDDGTWVINGHKVWSSGAHYAHIGQILCRTDRDVPKHRGITAFMIDMDQPGIDVRPIREASGKASFNEVFLDNVLVSDARRLGEVGQGWEVAMATLRNERRAIARGGGGAGNKPSGAVSLERLAATARHFGRTEDPDVRRQFVATAVARMVADAQKDDPRISEVTQRRDGSEMALSKLLLTRSLDEIATFVRTTLEEGVLADEGTWGTYAWSEFLLDTMAMKIAGGTTEILKNIVAERVLELPR